MDQHTSFTLLHGAIRVVRVTRILMIITAMMGGPKASKAVLQLDEAELRRRERLALGG